MFFSFDQQETFSYKYLTTPLGLYPDVYINGNLLHHIGHTPCKLSEKIGIVYESRNLLDKQLKAVVFSIFSRVLK